MKQQDTLLQKNREEIQKLNARIAEFIKKDTPEQPQPTSILNAECIICLSELQNGDELYKLSCNHPFHLQCLAKMVNSRYSQNICCVCLVPMHVMEIAEIQHKWKQSQQDKKNIEKQVLGMLQTWNDLDKELFQS